MRADLGPVPFDRAAGLFGGDESSRYLAQDAEDQALRAREVAEAERALGVNDSRPDAPS